MKLVWYHLLKVGVGTLVVPVSSLVGIVLGEPVHMEVQSCWTRE